MPDNTIDIPLRVILINNFRHGELDLENANKEIVELFDNRVAQEANKAVIKELTELERYLDLPYHELARKAVRSRIAQLTADKEQADG